MKISNNNTHKESLKGMATDALDKYTPELGQSNPQWALANKLFGLSGTLILMLHLKMYDR